MGLTRPGMVPIPAGTFVKAFPTETYTLNPDGSLASETDTVTGIVTNYSYNADGSLHTETVPALGITRTYAYDGAGNLTGVS